MIANFISETVNVSESLERFSSSKYQRLSYFDDLIGLYLVKYPLHFLHKRLYIVITKHQPEFFSDMWKAT